MVNPVLPIHQFIHSFIHSFKNLNGAPSRNLFRDAPIPATAKQISLKPLAERVFIILKHAGAEPPWEPNSAGGPTLENARGCLIAVVARGAKHTQTDGQS